MGLVRAAARQPIASDVQRVLFVLCDFLLWKSLVDAGLSRRKAEDVHSNTQGSNKLLLEIGNR